MMEKKLFFRFSFLLYTLGICWVLLFPLVSITTGELKPRQMFVDENALLSTSIQEEKWWIDQGGSTATTDHILSPNQFKQFISSKSPNTSFVNTSMICQYLLNSNHRCSHESINGHDISSLLIAPRSRPMSNEVIVFGVLITEQLVPSWILDMTKQLIINIESSSWLSKSILLIFIPKFDETNIIVETWVQKYHRPDLANPHCQYHGVIRFALFLDLISSYLPSESLLRPPLFWKGGIGVSFIGAQGLLPNLDTISSLFSLPSNSYTSIYYSSFFSTNKLSKRIQSFLHILSLPLSYIHKLTHLILFLTSLILGPNGPHAPFLSQHINSFTLIPLSPSISKASSNLHDQQQGQVSWKQLFNLIGSAIHLHSNLHGLDSSTPFL